MVAVDPATGGILAYYGGDNGTGLDYARVRRLAGSTFKPFVVLAGLRESPPIGIGETFDGAARPGLRNAEGAECARCDLKQAMTVSNNVVFSDMARRVGPQKVADAARAAGITFATRRPERGHRSGQQGGQHARAGLGVRHRRGRLGGAPAAPGLAGRHRRRAGAVPGATGR